MENRRVEICPITKKEVEQIQEPNGNWLCLHDGKKEELNILRRAANKGLGLMNNVGK